MGVVELGMSAENPNGKCSEELGVEAEPREGRARDRDL